MPTGFFAPAAGLLWNVANHYGLDSQALFKEVGILAKDICDTEQRFPIELIHSLWEEVIIASNDPAIAIRAAEYLHPSHLGALGYAWLNSRSLKTALERLSRYIILIAEHRKILLTQDGDDVCIEIQIEPSATLIPRRMEINMASLMTMCRWNFGPLLRPRYLYFQQEISKSKDELELFFNCPISFNQPINAISLNCSDVNLPLLSGNSQQSHLHDEFIKAYLDRFEAPDFLSRVKKEIGTYISDGAVPIGLVASCMHVSVRTLQRRLGEHGVNFKHLVDTTRREVVEKLMLNKASSLTEICFTTGYSTQSGFTSAVRRWTGMTPTEYRHKLLSQF